MPTQYTHRVILALEVLKQNPAPVPEYDVKKLQGLKDMYRIRIGDIRIVYQIVWEFKRIKILTVEFRGRAYR